LIALLQAGSSGSETILGNLLSILNSFIVICIGYVVTTVGQFLDNILQNDGGSDTATIHPVNLTFGGGIIFLFFWTAMLALLRFHDAVHSIWAPDSTSNQSQFSSLESQHTVNISATSQSEFQLTAAAEPPPAYHEYKQAEPSTEQQETDNIES
jgi:hypothetical protein